MNTTQNVLANDPAILDLIKKESKRQQDGLEMIASENYASKAVMDAQGSILTNKYAEGYPGKRYYGGCEFIDGIETLAIERAKKLFHVAYANVQPHAGSQANMAVYMASMKPGETMGIISIYGCFKQLCSTRRYPSFNFIWSFI